jgi:TetR/AcrR family fatty acid metabolism transcriptional regulator
MPPAHARTVVRDPDAKKRTILEAARRLLIARGFEDIALEDVAREAGVAKGTVFLHYESKDDLFFAVFSELVESLRLELQVLAKTGLGGKEMLTAAVRVLLGHFDRHRDFLGQVGMGRLPGCGERSRGKLREKFASNHALVRRLLELSSSDEGRSLDNPEFAAAALIGLCRSAAMRKLLDGHERPLDAEAESVVAFFLNGSGLAL